MVKKIQDFKKCVEELEKDEETEGQKRVIMHDGEMLITRKPYGFMQSSFWVIMVVHVMVSGD